MTIAFPATPLIFAGESGPSMAVIESPCNKICTVDPSSGLCIGCARTLAEIGGWTLLTAQERRAIMALLPRRLASLRDRTAAART